MRDDVDVLVGTMWLTLGLFCTGGAFVLAHVGLREPAFLLSMGEFAFALGFLVFAVGAFLNGLRAIRPVREAQARDRRDAVR